MKIERIIIAGLSMLLLFCQTVNAQVDKSHKIGKKEKTQNIKADRLFIEGQKNLMLEDYEKAYFYFRKALEIKPNEGAINFKLAEILLKANRVDEALPYGLKAVAANPENKYYNLAMAEVYSKKNEPQKAADILENLMSNSEENQNYILDLASLYMGSGDFDKALEAFNRAEEYYGVAEQLTIQKQRIYLRKNDLSGAIREGQNLIEAHPGNSQYVLSLVEILFNNGRTDDALLVIQQSLANYPNQPDLQLAAYALYKEKSDLETAEALILKAFGNPDLEAQVKAQAFSDVLQEIKTEKREKLLDQLEALMLENNPNDAEIYTVLGDRKMMAGNKVSALESYKKSISINSANDQVLQGIITMMFETGKDFDKIEKYTSIAVEEFPARADFWFFDGTAKSAQKKSLEAEESLVKALEVNQSKNKQLETLVYGQLGDTFHSIGKKQEAYDAYEKVLKTNPEDEHVLNNYAYFLSLAKKDLEKAKTMSGKLILKFPENTTYLDTHAWVLFQLKDYEGAKKYMEKALLIEETPSGVMLEHFGDILYHLGNRNEAIAYWKKAQGGDETSNQLNKKIQDKKYYE
ncbi:MULTISPECIES: tetratricopeptide repeat protein [Rhodonellum]|nr:MULTISPECIES: tetratricopeptide repeat protein [Rhodonellum]